MTYVHSRELETKPNQTQIRNVGIICGHVLCYWWARVQVHWFTIHPNQHLLSGLSVQMLCP